MSLELALGLGLLVGAAAFTQGAAGFGFGMVVMAVMPLVLGVRDAVLHVSLLALALNATLVWAFRRGIEARALLPLAPGALVGAPLGVALLRASPPLALRLTLGVILVAYALHGLRVHRPGAASPDADPETSLVGDGVGIVAGLAAGVLGGAFNTGGPPVILYCHARRLAPLVFKGVLQAFFLAGGIAQVTTFALAGDLDGRIVRGAALLLPWLAAGSWLGIRWAGRIDAERFRRGVLWLLLVLGLGFLGRALGDIL